MIKKQITLVITDSGLGGLSVCAGMAAKFVGDARYDRIHLVYFNAWSEQDKGTGTIRIRRPGPRCLTMPGSHSPIQPRSHLHCLQHPVRDLSVYPVCKRDGNSCHRHCGPWVQMIYDALIRDASASVVVFAPPPSPSMKIAIKRL